MTTIAATLDDIRVGKPVEAGPLFLFPLISDGRIAPPYLCGAQAIRAGILTVREHQNPLVHELLAHNKGTVPALLVQGELLVGLHQDRVVNVTILCPPGATIPVPVSCVEAGRWGGHDARPVSSG